MVNTFIHMRSSCVYSLQLMGKPSELNVVERKEMKRRTMQMLLYLMRSPFYDNYTRYHLLRFHFPAKHQNCMLDVSAQRELVA